MILREYPIQGPHRLPQMMMEWIFMTLCIELSIIFLSRYLKQDKQLKNLQDLGFSILLFCFGTMILCFIMGDY